MNERLKRLNIYVIFFVIFYTICMQSFFTITFNNVLFGSIVNFLTSIGFYEFLLLLLYALISRSDTLLKLYWGKIYLKGLWSYTYTLNNVQYKGIWRIEQDLFETKVIGYGIDDNGKPRSDVRSVTDLYERNQSYEIINIRKDIVQIIQENYSKTTLFPDYNPKGHFLSVTYPTRMRAITTIYGGTLSGNIHTDVIFIKHEDSSCEEDVVRELIHLRQ